MRNIFIPVVLGGVFLSLIPIATVAQSGGGQTLALEEIVVSARKRSELLKDVPVSISVMTKAAIDEAGLESQFDLFELTPGVTFDQVQDRQASRPSVRGVQSQAQNPVRQKVSSFLDGVPVLGQTGSLQFIGVDQIEILRGPQSAAFGRATFAGAINYISSDPGDVWQGDVQLLATDLGRQRAAFSVGGPITENLGIIVDGNFDEFDGPDEWKSSDGYQLGGTSTDYLSTKLKFNWGEASSAELRYTMLEADDDPPIEYYISEASLNSCSNYTLNNGNSYIKGGFNCALPNLTGGVPRNHAPEQNLTPGTDQYFLAQSWGVLDPQSGVDRERVQLNLEFGLANGGAIEVLASNSDDELLRWSDSDNSDAEPVFAVNMMTGAISIQGINSMANPNTIEESYAEVRWVSPGDDRLRWVVGASWFDYESETNIYNQYAGLLLGLEDEANGGNPFTPNNILADASTTIGYFASLKYDFSDRTTGSVEIRYQEDEITNFNTTEGIELTSTTDAWQPRVAINHEVNDDWSIYGQVSIGTNPAGSNLPFTIPGVQASLAAAQAAGFTTFGADDFLTFDEEKLTNFEFGVKGATSDGRLQLAAAIYLMKWEDMIQPVNFNWDDPSWNDGSFDPNGTIFNMGDTMARTFINTGEGELTGIEVEGSYAATDNLVFRGAFSFSKSEYVDSCDPFAVQSLFFTPTTTTADGAPTDCVDVDGNDLIASPEVTAALAATYTRDMVGDWTWQGRLDYRYQASEYWDAVNVAELPAFSTINAALSFRNPMFDIRLYVNNLTDEDTPQSLNYNLDGNIGGGTRNFLIRPRLPREIGLRLTANFGQN